jgi:hypothetical protein
MILTRGKVSFLFVHLSGQFFLRRAFPMALPGSIMIPGMPLKTERLET